MLLNYVLHLSTSPLSTVTLVAQWTVTTTTSLAFLHLLFSLLYSIYPSLHLRVPVITQQKQSPPTYLHLITLFYFACSTYDAWNHFHLFTCLFISHLFPIPAASSVPRTAWHIVGPQNLLEKQKSGLTPTSTQPLVLAQGCDSPCLCSHFQTTNKLPPVLSPSPHSVGLT